MADCPRVYIHTYCPTAYRDMILQKHTLFYLQDDALALSPTHTYHHKPAENITFGEIIS